MSTEEEGGDPVVGDGASTAAGPELIRRTQVGSPESRLYLIYISILGLGLVVPFLAGGALLGLSFTTTNSSLALAAMSTSATLFVAGVVLPRATGAVDVLGAQATITGLPDALGVVGNLAAKVAGAAIPESDPQKPQKVANAVGAAVGPLAAAVTAEGYSLSPTTKRGVIKLTKRETGRVVDRKVFDVNDAMDRALDRVQGPVGDAA